jgi:hypothetical protein
MVPSQERSVIYVGSGTSTGTQIFRFTDTGQAIEILTTTIGPSMNIPVIEETTAPKVKRASWKQRQRELPKFLK